MISKRVNNKIFFLIRLIEYSPYFRIKKETRKNLKPREIIEKKIKAKRFIPNTPEAMHVIL